MKSKKETDLEFFGIAGNNYYFDLDELSEFIRIERPGTVESLLGPTEEDTKEEDYSQVIDVSKWETTKVKIGRAHV